MRSCNIVLSYIIKKESKNGEIEAHSRVRQIRLFTASAGWHGTSRRHRSQSAHGGEWYSPSAYVSLRRVRCLRVFHVFLSRGQKPGCELVSRYPLFPPPHVHPQLLLCPRRFWDQKARRFERR